MKYLQTKRRRQVEYEELVSVPVDGEEDAITEVLINIKLKQYNDRGLSFEMLQDLIIKVTSELSTFRIFHTPDGLTITGRY